MRLNYRAWVKTKEIPIWCVRIIFLRKSALVGILFALFGLWSCYHVGICVCVLCFFLEVPWADLLTVMVARSRLLDELLLPVV